MKAPYLLIPALFAFGSFSYADQHDSKPSTELAEDEEMDIEEEEAEAQNINNQPRSATQSAE